VGLGLLSSKVDDQVLHNFVWNMEEEVYGVSEEDWV
jgi:hypothetical protein